MSGPCVWWSGLSAGYPHDCVQHLALTPNFGRLKALWKERTVTERLSPGSHAATVPSWSRTMTSLKSYVPGGSATSEVHLSSSPHVISALPHQGHQHASL